MITLSRNEAERGTVLIVVSGVIATLGLMAYAFLVIMAGRLPESRGYLATGVAREAAKSALEYCYSGIYVGLYSSYYDYRQFQATSLNEAVAHVNFKLFDEQRPGGIYYLEDRDDFTHDALDITPHENAPLSSYIWGGTSFIYQEDPPVLPEVDLDELERTLDPVGAAYTCKIDQRFSADGLVEPTDLSVTRYKWITGESYAYIRVFGWGRVFDRIGEGIFVPRASDMMTAKIKLRLYGWVKLIDPETPEIKQYMIFAYVRGTTDKRRLSFDDPLFPKGWKGKTWFME